MRQIRLLFRFFFFALVLVCYFLVAIIIVSLKGFSFDRARHMLTVLIAFTCKAGLRIFNIKIIAENQKNLSHTNALIIANHQSYIDVFAISSIYSTSFVTSHEMRKTPFLGQLCQFGGCLFVDRKNHRNLNAEVNELAHALKQNIPVTIFPEATSHNGEKLHPFRKPLFQAAINANVKLLPLCLNYERLNGKPITLKNRDVVFWYGDFPFFSHAVSLFSHDELVVRVKTLYLISVEGKDKHTLSEEAYQAIGAHFKTITA
jgi:1-acyl-sn-glycerol-3-phosphate acyltransferase